jgi:hypothetical protein
MHCYVMCLFCNKRFCLVFCCCLGAPGGGSSNWYLPGGFSYHEGDPSDSRMTAAGLGRVVLVQHTVLEHIIMTSAAGLR